MTSGFRLNSRTKCSQNAPLLLSRLLFFLSISLHCGPIEPSYCIYQSTRMVSACHLKIATAILSLTLLLLAYLTIQHYALPTNIARYGDQIVFSTDELRSIFVDARLSPATEYVTRDALRENDTGQFHIVTNFVPFNSEDLRKNLRINDKAPTDQQLEARMAEVLESLQRNLKNSLIEFVHVLAFREEAIAFLQSLELRNSHKLIIHKNDRWPTMLDQIVYSSKYLQGKIVIMCHQDNYLGEGWDKVNGTVLKKERLMYALTRHPSPSKCNETTLSPHCGMGYSYVGSHDAFMFYVNGEIDREKLVEIDVTPNMYGMENLLMWIFQSKFKYRILNPCKVLVVYHNHCVGIRETGRRRINPLGKTAMVPFTDKLQ